MDSTTATRGLLLLLAALVVCLGLALARADAASAAAPNPNPLAGSTFQGADGDQLSSSPPRTDGIAAATTDWQNYGGLTGTFDDPFPGTTGGDEYYKGQEDTPDTWVVDSVDGGITPAKSNALAVWGTRDPATTDVFFYFSFLRQSTSGADTFFGVELNQSTTKWVNSVGTSIPCRTTGDLMISYEVTPSQKSVTFKIYKWTGNPTGPPECPTGRTGSFTDITPSDITDYAQGYMNFDAAIANFLSTAQVGATIAAGRFGEGAVNLAGALPGTGTDTCVNFGQAQLHTRSSSSLSSALQDTVDPQPIVLRSCTASGTKYEDVNGNGTRDAGEPGLAGWTMWVDKDEDGAVDAGEPSAVTDADGNFTIAKVPSGTWDVREKAPAGDTQAWYCSQPGPAGTLSSACKYGHKVFANNANVDGLVFGNYRRPTVEVRKNLVPSSDGGRFDLKIDGTTEKASAGDGDTTTARAVSIGTHSVAEAGAANPATDLADYSTTVACTKNGESIPATLTTVGGEPTVSGLSVESGDHVVCTFVNKKQARVTVVKDAAPKDGTDFGFASSLPGGTAFALDNDADGTLPAQRTFTIPGADTGKSYDVSEDAIAGWSLTDLSCTGASATIDGREATFAVAPGDEITCTYTNKQDAKVTIVKDAQPASGQDFAFTTTGAQLSDFTLDDDNDPTLPDSKTFTVSGTGFGAKTITETAVAGWTNTGLTCSEGSVAASTATIDVQPGDDITCTFVNKQDAKVTIVKDAAPKDGTDFGFTSDLPGGTTFKLDNDADGTLPAQRTVTVSGSDLAKPYHVSEDALAGWSLTGLSCTGATATIDGRRATFTVAPGDQITCTYTNKQDATVKVIKEADPADGTDFGFTSNLPGGSSFQLDVDADGTLPDNRTFTIPGADTGKSYDVTEDAIDGWALTDHGCTGVTADKSGRKLTFAVEPGAQIVCTFANKKAASVTIVKDAAPKDGTDFAFASDLPGGTVFALDNDADGTLPAQRTFTIPGADTGKSYDVSEDAIAGWSLTDLSCTGASATIDGRKATFAVAPGDDITCTFVNKQDAKVTIVKDAIPNDPQDFTFTTDGLGASFKLDDDNDPALSNTRTITVSGDGFGTKSVTESAASGWDLTGLTCTDPAAATEGRTATLAVAPGDEITCTFENTKRGKVTVEKTEGTAGGALTRDWTFRLTGGPEGVNLVRQATAANDGAIEFGDLEPGDYKLCEEDIPAGWYSTLEQVSGAQATTDPQTGLKTVCVAFAVAPGEDEHFDVINRRPQNLVVKEGNALVHHGDTLTFTFDVTNVGNTPLVNVAVSDDHCPVQNISPVIEKSDGEGADETPDTLDPGDHWIYTCTMPVPAHAAGEEDPIVNTVTATAEDLSGNPVSDTDRHTTDVLHPALDLDKQVRVGGGAFSDGPVEAYVGDTLTYQVAVKNTGDARLALTWGADGTSQAFVDAKCDAGTIAGPAKAGGDDDADFEPGETWTWTCTHVVRDGDGGPIVNAVKVTGIDDLGGDTGTVSDEDSTRTDILRPAIAIDKTGPATGRAGDLVSYTLDVTNPGNVSFADPLVVVADQLCQAPPALVGKNGDAGPATLDPGDRWTYRCQVQTTSDQQRVDNLATVTGTDRNGRSVSAQDTLTTMLERIAILPNEASARLRGPAGCIVRPSYAYVTGKEIRRVVFYLDGKRKTTLRKADAKGRYKLRIVPRSLQYGRHKVKVVVSFEDGSTRKGRPSTLTLSFSRCRPAIVTPKFTG